MSDITLCETAIARFGPGKKYKLAAYNKHVASCDQCTKAQKTIRRDQRQRTSYSRDFPLGGDSHKYLLIVPRVLWQRVERRRLSQNVSARSVLNKLLDYYAEHDLPKGS